MSSTTTSTTTTAATLVGGASGGGGVGLADDANVVVVVNQTGTGMGMMMIGVGGAGGNVIAGSNNNNNTATAGVAVAAAPPPVSSVRSQKPIDLRDHHLRTSGGTVPKQQHAQDHDNDDVHRHGGQYQYPLDMSLGGDVTMMDSSGCGAMMLLGANVDNINDPAFTGSHYLNLLLDDLLMPDKRINDPETIDWCKWLIAGGRIPEDFAQIGELGLVLFFDRSRENLFLRICFYYE